MSKHLDITDAKQGQGKNEKWYGYCGITDRGGQFFTWLETLAETLDSIEDDDCGGAPDHWPNRAYQEVRGFIRRSWKKCGGDPSRIICVNGREIFQ